MDKTKVYLYNTATGVKEEFIPRGKEAGMYCCGPTVYNYAHIGNLRTYISEDVLKRALLSAGYSVKHVVNITDVGHLTSDADTGEDKMEKGSRREGKSVWDIAGEYTDKFMEDISSLNISMPDKWPRATEHIDDMIEMIETLTEKGYTYQTGDGIYFDTSKFPDYCKFAGLDPENLQAGSRVSMGDKKNPTDFALWKFSPEDVKRQMEWESPWGVGFPGWHIECSVMALKYLEQPVDIHCGGTDHIRVHHTNEIAQTEAATGKKFVNLWFHGEFLNVKSGKMAKSGGNFLTLDKIKEKNIDPAAYRLFCYSAHYRSPLTFSWDALEGAHQGLVNLRKKTRALKKKAGDASFEGVETGGILEEFYSSVYDDLNMPRAVAALHGVIDNSKLDAVKIMAAVSEADKILALDLITEECEEAVVRVDESNGVRLVVRDRGILKKEAEIIDMIIKRRKSRADRDFALADSIRDELKKMKLEIRDLQEGITECVEVG